MIGVAAYAEWLTSQSYWKTNTPTAQEQHGFNNEIVPLKTF